MNTNTKALLDQLESIVSAQIQPYTLTGQAKQTIRRGFRREARALLESMEPPKVRTYSLSARGKRKLQESMSRLRSQATL